MDVTSGQAIAIALGFAVLVVLLIVLLLTLSKKSRKSRAAGSTRRVTLSGASASVAVETPEDLETVMARARTLVADARRYSKLEEDGQRMQFRVKGNFYTWGEVMTLEFLPHEGGTKVHAECRPSVKTTVIDYGQSGDDLAEFVDALVPART
jgi:hypothetical protein